MTTNRSMPPGEIIAEIPYSNVLEAAEWLCHAFGFKKRLQIADHRIQLTFGNNSLVVTEKRELAHTSASIMLHMENIDHQFEHAVTAGARVVSPPTDYPFGERQCVVEDPGGNRWTFSQSISDVDPKSWGGILFE
ncbi:MAG: VOC family protein [Anaerolineales bacterium]